MNESLTVAVPCWCFGVRSCRAIMVICCALGCTNAITCQGDIFEVFRLPSNEVERQKWLEQLGLDDVSPNAKVYCARQFPCGTTSTAGLLPTLSKAYHRKQPFSVVAVKRSRVTASFTWSPSN